MFRSISYRQRIYLSFTLIFVVVFGVGGGFFFRYNADLLRRSAESNAADAAAVIQMRIDDRLQSLDSILKRVQVSDAFMRVASSIPDALENFFDAHPSTKAELNGLLLSAMISEALSTEISFVSRYYDYIGVRMAVAPYSRVNATAEDVAAFPFVQRALSTKEYEFVMAPRQSEWLTVPYHVFSVIRVVNDNFTTYGLLEISQNVKELDAMCKISDLQDGYTVFLLDETGMLRYQHGEAQLPDEVYSPLWQGQGVAYHDDDSFYCYQRSELSDWTLVLWSDFSAVVASVTTLRNSVIVIYLIACAVILGFFFFIAANLTRPLSRLKDHLATIQVGGMTALGGFGPEGSNEVALISTQIEHILLRIHKQNELIVQTRKRELQAQMRMLEAQMDPHFLYNALAVIGASAYEDGNEKVYHMLNDLADLLRYTIRNESQSVRLDAELENIRQYLAIMQMRYENMMEVSWTLEESLGAVRVPKLVLQPIVENCFKHGFLDVPPAWLIHIRTYAEGTRWRVSIGNNGRAFGQEDIARLHEEYCRFARSIEQEEGESAPEPLHFGLENTLKRLHLRYGENAYYAISVRHGWTYVEIGGEMDV